MEPAIPSMTADLSGPKALPFRPALHPVPPLTIDGSNNLLRARELERKRSIGSSIDHYASSPASSFSRDSFTDLGSATSTRYSTPSSPASSITERELSKFNDDLSQSSSRRSPLKRDREGDDEPSKRPRLYEELPKLNDLIKLPQISDHGMLRSLSDQTGNQWRASNAASPSTSEYTLSRAPPARHDDIIVRHLNELRAERESSKGLPLRDFLSQPPGLVTQPPNLDTYYPREQKDPLKPAKQDQPHCNVKYQPDQKDFIRYMKIDKKKTWNEIKEVYAVKFFKENLDREVQGIQGVHYRENSNLPSFDESGRLQFMNDGHVKPGPLPVRSARDKSKHGLMWLFPDRAMNWDWVLPADRQFAQEIYEERRPQFEEARRKAIEAGTWVEKSDACACCVKEDDKPTKRVTRRRCDHGEFGEALPVYQGIQAYPLSRNDFRSML